MSKCPVPFLEGIEISGLFDMIVDKVALKFAVNLTSSQRLFLYNTFVPPLFDLNSCFWEILSVKSCLLSPNISEELLVLMDDLSDSVFEVFNRDIPIQFDDIDEEYAKHYFRRPHTAVHLVVNHLHEMILEF